MHVVLLGPFPPPHGGVQTHVVSLRAFLRAAGVRVSVINITRHRKADADGVYYPHSALGLLTRVARLRPDLLHVHLGGQLTTRTLALCCACARWPGAVSVLTFHSGGYPSSAAGRAASPRSAAGMVLRRMDHLIAVNPEIEFLFHRFGVPASSTSLIGPHAGLDSPEQAEIPPEVRHFLDAHTTLLVTVGLLEPEYQIATQIEALTDLRRDIPGAGLVIVGSGSLERDLRAAIAASPAADHILLCGDLPHALTLHLIRTADALLRTTAFDGDSLAVREALAAGTRVLASDNGMRPPGVQLLSDAGPEHLAARIGEVLAAPRPPRTPGNGDTGNLGRILSLYEQLVGSGPR